MTTRKNTFLLKRSNVPGKVPSPGDLQLGELALNTSDAILYTSGTTANSILPIGWDRLSTLSGGTVYGDVIINGFVSATTYYNLPTFSGQYLPLSGGTVYGDTIFTSGLTASTIFVKGLTQTSGLTSTGGIIFPHKTILNTYNVTTSDYFINITGGTLDVRLLSAVGVQGKLLAVKNEGSGIVNVISQSGQTIDDRTNVLLTKGNSVQLVSDGTNWVILGYNISSTQTNTGVISFSGLSKVTNTTFYVGPVKGFIVDDTTNPVIPFLTYVEYSGGVHTDNYVNTDFETFVYITSGGTIGQQPTPLTEQQRRQNIFLGKLGHPEKISINLVFSQPDYIQSPLSQLRDMFVPINLINGGVVPSTNGVNLKFNTSAGYLYGLGINFTNNTLNPNSLFIPGTNPCTFQYRTQTGGTVTNVTDIDPLNYDVGGIKTPIIGTKASNQRIYLLQNGSIRVQYGQHVYTTLAQAVEELQTETFVPFPNFINNAVLIGILTVLSTATDLTDTAKARFFFASKFGETVGAAGGISTTNLQQAYNNSSNPEIITNSIQNAVQFRGGTGNDYDKSVVFENNVGSQTAYIRADGKALFNTISATTIGDSGSCVTNLYVSNISSCSPLNIQPNNVGNVYFGSTSAVTIDLTNNRVGIGTTTPEFKLDTLADYGRFYVSLDNQNLVVTSLSGSSSGQTDIRVESPGSGQLQLGIIGSNYNGNTGGGKVKDSFVYSSVVNNGLNFITAAGTGTDDYFRFYAGQFALTGNTPDIHIQGSGTTRGYVGIGNENPTAKLHINNTTSGNSLLVEDDTNPDTTPFVIDSIGRIGVGTLSPLTKLHVIDDTGIRVARTGSSVQYIDINQNIVGIGNPAITSYSDPTNAKTLSINATTTAGNATPSSGSVGIQFNILGINSMYIDSSQNVGIGTGTPPARLTVVTSGTSTGSYPAISGTTQTGNISRLRNGGSNLVLDIGGFSSNGNWLQSTNQTDLSLTYPLLLNPNGGKVGINLTSPSESLHVSGNTIVTGNITASNLLITGGTQSIFSGNSSLELVRITQTGSGNAFVVEDSVNTDSSHFVIDANGNTAIGLTTPREKLDISGNTIVSGTLSGGTIVITTEPTSGFTTTQILMRNSTSGQVEITDSTSPSIYNYGMSYAMTTFNYLT